MARLRPLARRSGSHSNSAHETDPTRPAGRSIHMGSRHGVADTATSINGITPEPEAGSGRSVDDLDPLFPHEADCAGTDTAAASAACSTNDFIDC